MLAPDPPVETGWLSAGERAETIGARVREATATAALSMMRLMIISATSASTSTGSTATSAIFQASWSSWARFSSERWTRTVWSIRSEEHTSELQSRGHLVCRLLLEKKNNQSN